MKCPYCSNEMEKGIIQSPQEIAWNSKKRIFANSDFNDDSVVLSRLSMLKGSAVITYLCRDCKKIIIDYEEEHDLNDMKKDSFSVKINDMISKGD